MKSTASESGLTCVQDSHCIKIINLLAVTLFLRTLFKYPTCVINEDCTENRHHFRFVLYALVVDRLLRHILLAASFDCNFAFQLGDNLPRAANSLGL